MITALDHIAIAVPDLEKAINRFLEDFGLPFEGTEDVEAARTSTAFFPLPPTNIELIHPLRGEGPVAKYLEKRGWRSAPPLFSLGRNRCRRRPIAGERLRGSLADEPGPGAHGARVIFIHPRSCDGC